jgi:hypothetical protein
MKGESAVVERLYSSSRMLDIHPEGTRYLTVGHAAGELAQRAFPDGEVQSRRESLGGGYESSGGYVSRDRALWAEEDGHLLLDARGLEVVGQVAYPEGVRTDYVLPAKSGEWLSADIVNARLQLWRAEAMP